MILLIDHIVDWKSTHHINQTKNYYDTKYENDKKNRLILSTW